MRNQELETARQNAYERGQMDGQANKSFSNPYDMATQRDEHDAYGDGFEDGQADYERETRA